MPDQMDDRLKQSAARAKAAWGNRGGMVVPQNASAAGKLPPQAPELEMAVLGALMLEKDALTSVIDLLKPESFYKAAHKLIYEAVIRLFDKSEPIDQITVVQELREMGALEAAGGPYAVANLTMRVNSAANVEYHARIITETAIKRELIRISSDILRDAFEDTTDVFKLLDDTESALFEVSESNIRKNFDDMRSLMGKAIKELEEKKNQSDGLTGVPTGFTALDRVTSGWQPSDLVIIAARPGMGKCLGKGTKVLMFDGDLRNVEDVLPGDLLMGDDSTPRRVLSIARGRENMYWVRQNKGDDYRVNESHILSLKRSRNEGPHRHGDVLNITVKDYLAKGPKFRSNYKGYKVPWSSKSPGAARRPVFLWACGWATVPATTVAASRARTPKSLTTCTNTLPTAEHAGDGGRGRKPLQQLRHHQGAAGWQHRRILLAG